VLFITLQRHAQPLSIPHHLQESDSGEDLPDPNITNDQPEQQLDDTVPLTTPPDVPTGVETPQGVSRFQNCSV